MVLKSRISIDARELFTYFNKLDKKLVPSLDKVLKRGVQRMAGKIKQQGARKRISMRGSLGESLIGVSERKGVYSVVMNAYGLALDGDWVPAKKPQGWYVPLRRGNKINRWVMKNWHLSTDYKQRYQWTTSIRMSGKSFVKTGSKGGIRGGAIFVTPRPFIRVPVEKEMSIIDKEIKNTIQKVAK